MSTTEHILFKAQSTPKGFDAIEPRLILLARYVSTGRWYVPELCHDFYTISYVQQGHASVNINNQTVEVHPGSILLYSPHCPYHAHNNEPYMDYHTLIFRFCVGDHSQLPARFAAHSTLAITHLLNTIHKQVLEPQVNHRIVKSLLLEIMEHAHAPQTNHQTPQTSHVLQAMELIRKNLDHPFKLATLASQINLSPSRLSHLFKQQTNTSPGAYYLSLKMDHAKQLLCDSDHSLKQIADRMGYSSIHQFTRRFTATVGMPPGEYRKQQLNLSTQRIQAAVQDGGPVV